LKASGDELTVCECQILQRLARSSAWHSAD
jgi:hypothetical protein